MNIYEVYKEVRTRVHDFKSLNLDYRSMLRHRMTIDLKIASQISTNKNAFCIWPFMVRQFLFVGVLTCGRLQT